MEREGTASHVNYQKTLSNETKVKGSGSFQTTTVEHFTSNSEKTTKTATKKTKKPKTTRGQIVTVVTEVFDVKMVFTSHIKQLTENKLSADLKTADFHLFRQLVRAK